MNNYALRMSITMLPLCITTISFSMFTTYNIHHKRQYPQQKLQKKNLSFSEIIRSNDAEKEKSILLLKNEPETEELLLYDNMLDPDTKYGMAEHLDFKTERAYWCTNKENNIVGHNNWRKREKLEVLITAFNIENIADYGFSWNYSRECFCNFTAAIATRSHQQLALMLQQREALFYKEIPLGHLPQTSQFSSAKLLAIQMSGHKRIEFLESKWKDFSAVAIRQRNMGAIELLLEHECRLHLITKKTFEKFYNIKGYENCLDSQAKAFLEAIETSIESSDVEYFKLLVKHVHPDIINHPISRKTSFSDSYLHTTIKNCLSKKATFFDPEKGSCFLQFLRGGFIEEEKCTVLDYVYTRCHCYLHDLSPYYADLKELNWSLINFLRKYGALTYEELMILPIQQNKNYGFKLPKDYHETGFIFKDEANQTCYWVSPNLLDNAK